VKTVKKANKTKAEAARLLALIVKVTRMRAAVRELESNPDVARVLTLSHYGDGTTPHDIGCIDIPLHQIADGATFVYSRLVAGDL
jgi:hypothetical protein